MRNLAVMVFVVAMTPSTAWSTQIFEFTGGSAIMGGGDFSAGFTFSVTAPINVDGLLFWDEAGDGLVSSHEVGLWTSGGALISSVTVNNASTVVASRNGLGNWLAEDVPLMQLAVGDYVLGALQLNSVGGDLFRLGTSAIFAPEIVYGDFVTLTSPVLAMPTNPTGQPLNYDGPFGANLRLTPVPEPSTTLLLAGGLVLLARSRSFPRVADSWIDNSMLASPRRDRRRNRRCTRG